MQISTAYRYNIIHEKKKQRKESVHQNIQKIKKSEIKVWKILLPILLFVGLIMLIPGIMKGSQGLFDFMAWFYLAAAFVATMIDLIQGNVPFRLKSMIITFFSYIYRLFLELVLLALSVPVIIIMFVLGPVMFFIFFLSLGGLLFYTIEVLLGIDIKGMTVRHSGYFALLELGAMLLSGFIFFFSLNRTEKLFDFLIGKITDIFLYIEKLGRGSQVLIDCVKKID